MSTYDESSFHVNFYFETLQQNNNLFIYSRYSRFVRVGIADGRVLLLYMNHSMSNRIFTLFYLLKMCKMVKKHSFMEF